MGEKRNQQVVQFIRLQAHGLANLRVIERLGFSQPYIRKTPNAPTIMVAEREPDMYPFRHAGNHKI